MIEKYHITADNIWNFDEKGFLNRFARTLKRIMNREAYESGRVTKARQDGNREVITLLACSILTPTVEGRTPIPHNKWVVCSEPLKEFLAL